MSYLYTFLPIAIAFIILKWASNLKGSGTIKKILIVTLSLITSSFVFPIYINGQNVGVLKLALGGSPYYIFVILAYLLAIFLLVKKGPTKNYFYSAMSLIAAIVVAFLGIFYGPLGSISSKPFANTSSENATIIWIVAYLGIPFVSLIFYTILWISSSPKAQAEIKKYFG